MISYGHYTARPTTLKDVSASEITPTSLLIEWTRPEFIYGGFNIYYAVCGTQNNYVFNISHTSANVTGLSVFTRYECCVLIHSYWSTSDPSCVNATTAPGIIYNPNPIKVYIITVF